jgi:2-methylcitrate dehydratase PrpD
VRIAACQLPRSLYLPITHGSEARNTYLAHSAQLGLLAAHAALAGIDAPASLDTRRLCGAGEWVLLEAYLKQFAAVRHVHYGAAAALALRPSLQGRFDKIDRLQLHVYPEALTYCANRAPTRPIQAQFSLSYGVAHALASGELSPKAYTEDALNNALVRDLEAKVQLIEDKSIAGRGARLVVEAGDERLEHAVRALPALGRDALVGKFAAYARLPREAATRFLDAPGERPFRALLAELAIRP